MEAHLKAVLPGLLDPTSLDTVADALSVYKPYLHDSGNSASEVHAWAKKLADMARAKQPPSRLSAAVLMEKTFRDCQPSSVVPLQVVTVGVLVALLRQAATFPAVAAAACGALSELYGKLVLVPAEAGGGKEAANLLSRFLPETLKAMNHFAQAEAGAGKIFLLKGTQALHRALTARPSTLRPFYRQITAVACKLLAFEDETVRECAAAVLAVSPSAAPKHDNTSPAVAWQGLVEGLLDGLGKLLWHLDAYTAPAAEGKTTAAMEEAKKELASATSLPAGIGGSKVGRLRVCVALADRFHGLCTALEKCLFGGYYGEGQVPLLRIITVVERATLLHEETLAEKGTFAHQSMVDPDTASLVLHRLHAGGLQLLTAAIRRTRRLSVSFMSVISASLLRLLPQRSSLLDSRSRATAEEALACARECLGQWGVSGERVLARPLLPLLIALVDHAAAHDGSAGSGVSSVQGSDNRRRSAKRRRTSKGAPESWGADEAGDEGGEGGRAVGLSLLLQGLETMETSLTACGASLSYDLRSSCLSALCQTLIAIYNSNAGPPEPTPQAGALRLALVKALWAGVLVSADAQPAALAPALHIFRLATQDGCVEVKQVASLARSAAPLLVHPRAPSLFTPAPVDAPLLSWDPHFRQGRPQAAPGLPPEHAPPSPARSEAALPEKSPRGQQRGGSGAAPSPARGVPAAQDSEQTDAAASALQAAPPAVQAAPQGHAADDAMQVESQAVDQSAAQSSSSGSAAHDDAKQPDPPAGAQVPHPPAAARGAEPQQREEPAKQDSGGGQEEGREKGEAEPSQRPAPSVEDPPAVPSSRAADGQGQKKAAAAAARAAVPAQGDEEEETDEDEDGPAMVMCSPDASDGDE